MDLVKHDKRFEALKEELIENREKAQLFRTETEMRYSVLNDGTHPTKASKYWQCVREMNSMYEVLIDDDYMYKKLLIEARIEDKKANETDDELEKELHELEAKQKRVGADAIRRRGSDRIRELTLWSQLKAELNDGSFDTKVVNNHQKDSLQKQLENRLATLTQGSGQADVLNVLGPLNTITDDYTNAIAERKEHLKKSLKKKN